MSKTVIQFALMFVVLVVAQAVIFNRIALFSVALAFVFIYFIVRLPISLSSSKVIALSFLIGVAVDIFSDTLGMHALACTCVGALRRVVIRLYVPREDDVIRAIPSLRSLGLAVYAKYVATVSLLYCILVFSVEAMSFFHPALYAGRILASAALTAVMIIALDSFSARSAITSSSSKSAL